MKHNHICWCGTAPITPHEIGTFNCVRFMTDAPDFSDGTRYTFENQRGYYEHPCGCWSKRSGGSENSLDA